MDASELARWTRFAAKGGIGKCTAVLDCVAESAEDLMFLKEDEITVLMQIPDRSNLYLGYCEGVVGRFNGNDVRFHARLKKPIMTKRSSVSNQAKSPSPTSGGHTPSPKPPSDPPGPYAHRRVVTLTPRGSIDILGSGFSVSQVSSPDIRQEQPYKHLTTNGSMSAPSTPPFGSPTQPLRFQRMQLAEAGDAMDMAPPHAALVHMQAGAPFVLAPPVHITSSSVSSTSTLVEPSVRASPSSPPRPPTSNTSPSRRPASTSAPPAPHSTFIVSSIYSSPPPPSPSLPAAHHSPRSTAPTVHPLPLTPPAESLPITPPTSTPSTPPRKHVPASLDTPTPIAKHDYYHPTPPDTSTSSAFDTSIATTFAHVLPDPDSDGEVGIGLTLLQDLANGGGGAWGALDGDSDSDGDDEELERIRREGRAGLEREAGEMEMGGKATGSPASRRVSRRRDSGASSSASSRYSRPGSNASGSDVDGLRYEDTETGHGSVETHEQHHVSTHSDSAVASPVSPLFFPASTTRSPQEMTFPPVAPLSPSRKGKSGGQYEFPAPPTHTHTYSLTQDSLHDLAGLEHDRERRPSLAPSAGSTSDWEGASDIYDDYRYSRFSMGGVSVASGSRARRMSAASGKSVGTKSLGGTSAKSGLGGRRMSVGSSKAAAAASVVAGDYPVFVDNPEARSRADSATSQTHGGSRPSGDGYGRPSVESLIRARAGSSAAAGPGPGVPSITEHSVASGGAAARVPQQHPHQDGDHLNVKGQRHARNESLGGSESDASVYTQSSIGGGSVRSAVVAPSSHPAPNLSQPLGSTSTSTSSSARNSGGHLASSGNRPPPLNLAAPDGANYGHGPSSLSPPTSAQDAKFQLLHTTWGSPVPSPGQESNFSATGYTGTGDGFTGRGYTTPASASYFQGAGGLDVFSRALGAGGESSAAGAGTGAASALRQRIEVDRRPSPVPVASDSHHEHGPGRRVVVEDDDEMHSHTRSAPSSPAHTRGTFKTVVQGSPSPEPELVSQQRIGSLSIANRTPSPTEERKGSKDDVVLAEPPSPMVPSVPQPTPPITHPGPPSLQVPPASSTPPPTSHLRPSLSELRGGQPGQLDQGQRRSLFLPHPNAPKAPSAHSPGPMYIVQRQPPPPAQQQVRGGVIQIIKMVLAGGGGLGPARPGNAGRGPTIYGRTMEDLSASNGPVLMVFTTEPPPATAPPGSPARIYTPMPVVPPSPVRGTFGMAVEARQETPGIQSDGGDNKPASVDQRSSGVIPRANFFPKAGGARPRSRSFSGFNSTAVEVPLPVQRSREEGSQPIEMPSAMEVKQSLSPSLPTTSLPPSPTGKHAPKPSPLRSSALALPQNNNFGAGVSRGVKPPSSPLASGFSVPSVPESPTTSVGSNRSTLLLRNVASHSNLTDSPSPRRLHVTRPLSGDESSTSLPSNSSQQPGVEVNSTASAPRGRPSVDTDALSIRSNRSGVISPPTVGRQNSLRTKLSLPNLRRTIGRHDDASSIALGAHGADGDTLQVQDMDFELVRPNLAQFQAARSSEDSGVMGRETSVDVRQDQFRSASPTMSLNVPKAPTIAADASTTWQPMKATPPPVPVESETSMDAHRQREQKWMSVMAAVPPSQSKKSKKVKKLLFDGVPSSVRYLVWMHLTDGKARCVDGVYTQLGARGRVPAFANIERDVQRCFTDHPHLQSTQGPVLGLLQAYLTMVPDIQYTTGLTLITGQLLLIAPEEDAFWIFVSIMDTHIRPYFSSSTTQIEVDAALFSRAFESADSAVSKKVLIDMGVLPASICRPWFTSLFVGTLPNDYLNRVWDIFLCEGVPCLIRVALALISCLRRQILECTSEESLLGLLQRPSPSFLPASADAFISLAMSVKLKDDDVRKQRIKMEAQVKRQTQTPRLVSTPGAISLPRS